MSGDGEEAYACRFPVRRSSNLVIAALPRLEARGSGSITAQEATMVSSTRTSSAIAQSSASPESIRSVTLRAVALPLAAAAPIEQSGITEAELMREEVQALCSHMLWLRAWWQAHGDGIRAADRKAASSVHDHFVDGAIFARGVARRAGFDMQEDRIKNYAWGRSTQTMRVVVGGAQ